MGLMDDKRREADQRLRAALEPQLLPDEPLIGVVHANEQKTFSAKFYAVGVTPDRLLLVPVNRKLQAGGDPARAFTRDDITGSSVWGWGGSVADFLAGDSDQQIRIETAGGKIKLMVLGGNLTENALAGEQQVGGLGALVDFLLSARG